MLSRTQFALLVALALLALGLAVVNGGLFSENRALQSRANERQLFIQQTAQLEGLYRQLIQGVAELATRANDGQLAAVLGRQGITVSATPPAAPGTPAAPAAPRK